MKIVLLIGLPGSGKTHLLDTFSDDQWAKIDDPMGTIDLPEGKDLIIADVKLIFSDVLEKAEQKLKAKYGQVEIERIYFENAPEKCLRNVAYRNDGRLVGGFIRDYAKYYNPPENALVIWQPE